MYGRVSHLGKSVDEQLADLNQRAEAQHWVVAGRVFRDDGISASPFAKTKQRPAWQQVMDVITVGEVDVLAVWEISRATRDRAVWAALIAACVEQGVRIDANGRTHDPADPDDGFMLDLSASQGFRESAMISKRVNRAVRSRANDGLPHGKLAYGYRREYDPHTRVLLRQVPDEQQALVLREITHRLLAAETLYTVAADLNRRGVPSPATARSARLGKPIHMPWTPLEVRARALSPTIAGLRVHQGQVLDRVTATWPPIITEADHHMLVALLTDPTRRTWRAGGSRHLLPGIAECGECGGPMRRFKNNGLPAYNCAAGFCVSRRQDWVDAYVEEALLTGLEQPDIASLLVDPDDSGTRAAVAELDELRARLAAFADSAADGAISPASLARIEAKLLPAIADAQLRATPPAVPDLARKVLGPDARARWVGLEMPQRREVLRTYLQVWICRTDRPGSRHFDPTKITLRWR